MAKWIRKQMTYNWKEICELTTELEKYYSLEGDSRGEAMEALSRLSQYPDYISDELLDAVVTAMKAELKYYTENCKIVIKPETVIHDVAELEWNNENI